MYSAEYNEAGVLKLPARKIATVSIQGYSFYVLKFSFPGKEIIQKIFINLRERSERFLYARITRAAGDPSRYGVKYLLFN
jgi:hypothetical protein